MGNIPVIRAKIPSKSIVKMEGLRKFIFGSDQHVISLNDKAVFRPLCTCTLLYKHLTVWWKNLCKAFYLQAFRIYMASKRPLVSFLWIIFSFLKGHFDSLFQNNQWRRCFRSSAAGSFPSTQYLAGLSWDDCCSHWFFFLFFLCNLATECTPSH